MGIDWNPNFPQQIGVERRDAAYDAYSVSSNTSQHALHFRALQTANISNVDLYLSTVATTNLALQLYGNRTPFFCDMYPVSGAPYFNPTNVQIDTFNPNSVTGTSQIYNENLTQPINVNRIQSSGDGLYLAAAAINHSISVQYPTQNFPLDRQVIGIRMLIRAKAKTELRRVDTDGSFVYNFQQSLPGGGSFSNWTPFTGDTFIDGPTSPTWGWWTPQMVRDFKQNGPRKFQIIARGTGWQLDTARLEVMWLPERRIGVGITGPTDVGWVSFPMTSPAGTGTPAITSGQDYSVVLRRPVPDNLFSISTGTVAWRRLKGWAPSLGSPPVTGWGSFNMIVQNIIPTGSTFLTPPSIPTVQAANFFPYTMDIMCAMMVTGGPSTTTGIVTETAMPYYLNRPIVVHASSILDPASASQTITVSGPATGVTYGQTSAIVGWNTGSQQPLPTDTLRVEVWTVTGAPETRVFSPVERTFADISSQPISAAFPTTDENGTTRLIRFRHPESRTLPAGKYEIRFSSSASVTAPFRISSQIAFSHNVDQTFGRSTNVGMGSWMSGTTFRPLTGFDSFSGKTNAGDIQTTLMAVPSPVTGVGVAVSVLAAHHASVCAGVTCRSAGCSDEGSPFSVITWGVTSDTASDRYEIQRSDLIDDVFRTVAIIRGRFSTIWQDHEARIGTRSCYRIRSVRTDGIAGDWSVPVCGTLPGGHISLTFTSNAATGLAVTYPEAWTQSPITRDFTFTEYDNVQYIEIYGRERPIAFHPRERKGITFSRTILLNALCTVSPPTMGLFGPLRVLTWAAVPYICVRDGEGNRWFASVRVPAGQNIRGGEQWYAQIVVTEVADVPALIDTATAQLENEDFVP